MRAIESVTDLLEGQTRIEVDLEFSLGSSYFASIPNRLNLDEATLLGTCKPFRRTTELGRITIRNALKQASRQGPEPRSFVSRTFRWKWKPGQATPMSISEPF